MKRIILVVLVLALSSYITLAQTPTGSDQSILDKGIQLKNQGKYTEAFDTLSSMKLQFPSSSLLPAAEYLMGMSTLYEGNAIEAALQFQRVISKFPKSDQAKAALNMNGLIYRLYIAPNTNKKIFSVDPSFSNTIVELDEPTGMGIDLGGTIYVADRGKKVLFTIDPAGKLLNTSTILSPYSVSVSPANDVLIGNDSTLYLTTKDSISFPRVNPQTKARMGYLEEVRSAALNSKGQYLVVSGKLPGAYAFDAQGNPLDKPAPSRAEEFSKVLFDSRNYILLLSRRGESVAVFDPDGKSLFTLSKTGRDLTFGKIDDFAVDTANHIYLLTNNPKGVAIYSPAGKFLRYIGSDKTGGVFFEDSKLITVGPSGSIYVLDKGTKRIIKIG